MYYAHKYRLEPPDAHREELDRHRDICRQQYNHCLYRLGEYRENNRKLPSMSSLRSELPDLKQWWDGPSDVYSQTLQVFVEQLFDNLKGLSKLKDNGYSVGQLKWKPPREFRSFTYSQSQSVWLQARQEGRSDGTVTFETRGSSDTTPPRDS